MGGNEDIISLLARDAPLVDRQIAKIIPPGEKPREVYGVIWELLRRGGKRFRPAMCLTACEAVGGRKLDALQAAATIELFHNFTLIHDDIEDDSELRRGEPCLHRIYGIPVAINAGDGMLLYTMRYLGNLEPASVREILTSSFIEVLNGQGTELNWIRGKRWDIGEADYLAMAKKKTGAIIGSACEAGTVIGGGTKKQAEALRKFGTAVGVAFQIQDDILNLIGEEKVYKKEIGGDITEGKRTLMVIHAMRHSPKKESAELVRILSSNTRSQPDIKRAIGIMRRAGSIEYAIRGARTMVGDAKKQLSILPKNKSSANLLALGDFLINREY
ncbi:MAG: polyprenyl synthetase family protein [Candidatus Micrarchaeota archaeon]|nr:polyprenyl synthetase family protein [Candidatus Micrarchaeota archaeon]